MGTCSATVIAQDSHDHASNSQGQWIREATNVLTDGGFEDFRKGEYAGTRADATTGTVALTRIEGTRCPVEGTYTSMIFDAGRTTTFGIATWTADVPSGTSLRFQVAVSSTAGGPWAFVGPDGRASSCFTSSGTAFTTLPTGRCVCYRATFASDVARPASPTLSGFNLGLGGATSRVVSYTYGPNDNVVSRTTVDSATGITTDVRDSVTWPASDRINTQDQLLRRDVTSPGGTTTTWRYTYDSAGNMTSKTGWTQTTSYAWDSHNRLVQVTQPDGTTEAYTYDANGLMLSSRKSTDTAATTYVWRGNDLVQETAPDGTVTRYNVVNGLLVSFERGGETYTVQSDATLGHVRSVTDNNGTVVYTARYDAWGNMLAVTDNVPGGMPARYVGALGVRWDGDLGVYYMRHRWYDPGLQQFMSADPLTSNADLYEYANDGPAASVDPTGLQPFDWLSTMKAAGRSSGGGDNNWAFKLSKLSAGQRYNLIDVGFPLGVLNPDDKTFTHYLHGKMGTWMPLKGGCTSIWASDAPEGLFAQSVPKGVAILADHVVQGKTRLWFDHSAGASAGYGALGFAKGKKFILALENDNFYDVVATLRGGAGHSDKEEGAALGALQEYVGTVQKIRIPAMSRKYIDLTGPGDRLAVGMYELDMPQTDRLTVQLALAKASDNAFLPSHDPIAVAGALIRNRLLKTPVPPILEAVKGRQNRGLFSAPDLSSPFVRMDVSNGKPASVHLIIGKHKDEWIWPNLTNGDDKTMQVATGCPVEENTLFSNYGRLFRVNSAFTRSSASEYGTVMLVAVPAGANATVTDLSKKKAFVLQRVGTTMVDGLLLGTFHVPMNKSVYKSFDYIPMPATHAGLQVLAIPVRR